MPNEYLLTNGTGSYSSSNVLLGNTRKYHGLLVVSDEDIKRKVIISQLEEKLVFDGNKEAYLNTVTYDPGITNPNGSINIINKKHDNEKITLEYFVENIKIIKEIHLIPNNNQILVSYKILSPYLTNLKITPLLTNRSFHSLSKFENQTDFKIISESKTDLVWQIGESEYIKINSTKFRHFPKNIVYRNFYYQTEKERGYDYTEDLIYSGTMVFDIYPNLETSINILFSYLTSPDEPNVSYHNFKNHQPSFDLPGFDGTSKLDKLKTYISDGARQFVIQTKNRASVVAGYHWFEDWGRDTFISFNGLLLVPKNFDKAKKILIDWSKHIKYGLVPNRPGLDEYNSIDATLWYVVSIYNYFQATQDGDTVNQLLNSIKTILYNFKSGTLYGIHIDDNGFLASTDPTRALTWMDAVFDGKPFTSRIQCAVEIQMLWFNTLNTYQFFAKHNKDVSYDSEISEQYVNELLFKIETNFENFFWDESKEFLYDYINGEYSDVQIRPNSVIGLHLPFKLLSNEKAKKVLEIIKNNLVTPIGLKTLDSKDPNYCPEYSGDQFQRDKAYHNGTVWPWIYGLFLKSYLECHEYSIEAKAYVISQLELLWDFVTTNKLDYLPEIFSAESLKPDGCLSQAWNYATLMEVIAALD